MISRVDKPVSIENFLTTISPEVAIQKAIWSNGKKFTATL